MPTPMPKAVAKIAKEDREFFRCLWLFGIIGGIEAASLLAKSTHDILSLF